MVNQETNAILARFRLEEDDYIRAYEPGTIKFESKIVRKVQTSNPRMIRPPNQFAEKKYESNPSENLNRLTRVIGFEDSSPTELGWSIITLKCLKAIMAAYPTYHPAEPIITTDYPLTARNVKELRWITSLSLVHIGVCLSNESFTRKVHEIFNQSLNETDSILLETRDMFVGSTDLVARRLSLIL
jgi:hypothetical protein